MQVVDDVQQHTLVAASTLMPEIRGQLNGTGGANKVRPAAWTNLLMPCLCISARSKLNPVFLSVIPHCDRTDALCAAHKLHVLQEAAVMVGKKIAELCLQKNIEKVCFDRGGNIYHGRVQVRQLAVTCWAQVCASLHS